MLKALILCAAILTAAGQARAANVVLPEPQKSGGAPTLDAIAARASAAQEKFDGAELTTQELSTLLWAATGKNREPKGWTIPLAMGREPYVSVYVLTKKGGYLYDWDKNALIERTGESKVSSRAVSQDFAKSAPCVLVFVSTGGMNVESFNDLATGAMAQNVYLAAGAIGLKTRFLASFNKVNIEDALSLGPVARITGVMAVGRQ